MSQTLLICSSGLNRLKNENGKNKRKTESRRRNKIFSLKLTWGEIAIKFSSNSKACSFANKRHDGMVERLYNVTEIKNNKIIHSFFVERSWNQWLLLRKSFCTIRSRKKKMFSEILPQKSLRGR